MFGSPWIYTVDHDSGCFIDFTFRCTFTSQTIGHYGFIGYGIFFEPDGYDAELHDWGFFIIFFETETRSGPSTYRSRAHRTTCGIPSSSSLLQYELHDAHDHWFSEAQDLRSGPGL